MADEIVFAASGLSSRSILKIDDTGTLTLFTNSTYAGENIVVISGGMHDNSLKSLADTYQYNNLALTALTFFDKIDLMGKQNDIVSDVLAYKIRRVAALGDLGVTALTGITGTGEFSGRPFPTKVGSQVDEVAALSWNPCSKTLAQTFSLTLPQKLLIPSLINRATVLIQATKDIYIGVGQTEVVTSNAFILPATGVLGLDLSHTVPISIKPVTDPASVYVLQMGV